MRILWMSQHKPLDSQRVWLNNHFGKPVKIVRDDQPFSSAEEIVERYQAGKYDDIVVVAPLSVIAKLIALRVQPLWAEMDQVPLDQAEVTAGSERRQRGFRFNRFRRIIGLNLVFEELE